MFWVLTICLTIGFSNVHSSMEQCNVPATARINCGHDGITEAECKAKRCCYDSNVPNVPWCFKPPSLEAMEQCNVPATARINCGHDGITEAECKAKHCCFDSNVHNVPWCFKPASLEACAL